MNRDSFIFYRSFKEAMSDLSNEDKLIVYEAISEYALDQNEPQITGFPKALFSLIKPQLDANWKRFFNGKNGGAPIGNKNAEKQSVKQNKTTKKQPKNNQKTTKKQPNKNVNVNYNINLNKNEELNKRDNKLSLCQTLQSDESKIDFNELVSFVNEKFGNIYPNIRLPMTDKRKKLISVRIRDHGKKAFCEAIIKVVESKYLREQTWFNFDWMIKPTNFEKIISGNYDNKEIRRSITEDAGLASAITNGIARARYNKENNTGW